LLAGECDTVEPGVYAEPVGGVRIEDEVLVTDDGIELLTFFALSLDSLVVVARRAAKHAPADPDDATRASEGQERSCLIPCVSP
jgi:hypothetical protein